MTGVHQCIFMRTFTPGIFQKLDGDAIWHHGNMLHIKEIYGWNSCMTNLLDKEQNIFYLSYNEYSQILTL